jgi:hypothetical protein
MFYVGRELNQLDASWESGPGPSQVGTQVFLDFAVFVFQKLVAEGEIT